MDQSVAIEPGNVLNFTTPCKVLLRRLSSVQTNSSRKRSLFKDDSDLKKDYEATSDMDSDLGPMSPLALTDQSSCDSSPGRQFISPFATPEKSPSKALESKWDRLVPGSGNRTPTRRSPFSSLKRITKEARSTPRKALFAASPKSIQNCGFHEVVPETPGKESDFDDQASYIEETPQKDNIEQQLNTPLGSVSKHIPIPRLHRRKSFSNIQDNGNLSPEIKKCSFKRHLEDSLTYANFKHQNTDDLLNVPKARAALFQEKQIHSAEKLSIQSSSKSCIINTKSFYGSNNPIRKSIGPEWKQPKQISKPRFSLPARSASNKRQPKRNRKGEINCGVRHAIKRPKPKRPNQMHIMDPEKKLPIKELVDEAKENANPKTKTQSGNEMIVIDEAKKFFKTKVIPNTSANDKMVPESKKAKLDLADDLTVDEPVIEAAVDENKVNKLLQILEKDWADDDIEALTMSPKKSGIMLKNLTMSPASELSNMASEMNIDDQVNEVTNGEEAKEKQYYPIFSKGASSNAVEMEVISRKRKRNSNSWQLSLKYGRADNQYQIDAGQKSFGATQCKECGIIYCIGDPDDENAHLNYHNSFKTLKFQGWKNERVVFEDIFTASRIILIDPKDSNLQWKKVTEILEIVDRDLGLSDFKLQFYRDKKIYFYIRDKTIIGVLVADQINTAFRMIPDLLELSCCSSESTSVKCGINVVWTAMSHRRQGIASKLVDTLRTNYFYGYIMTLEDIAFSTPTPSGKAFAQSYTKTRSFKVY